MEKELKILLLKEIECSLKRVENDEIFSEHERNSISDLLESIRHKVYRLNNQVLITLRNHEELTTEKFPWMVDTFHEKLFKYINANAHRAAWDQIQVINSCEHCGHGYPKKSWKDGYEIHEYDQHDSDLWILYVIDDETGEYLESWSEAMGDDEGYVDEHVRIYRCCHCGVWDVDTDC